MLCPCHESTLEGRIREAPFQMLHNHLVLFIGREAARPSASPQEAGSDGLPSLQSSSMASAKHVLMSQFLSL